MLLCTSTALRLAEAGGLFETALLFAVHIYGLGDHLFSPGEGETKLDFPWQIGPVDVQILWQVQCFGHGGGLGVL